MKLSSAASTRLDFIRGVAAVLVMVSHVRALFFVTYPEVTSPNLLIKLFYLCTGLGHQAVMVFFVLSGFFISMSVLKSLAAGRWSWYVYAVQRLARLWVVLVPALLLTLFWDKIGLFYFGSDGVYQGLPSNRFILAFDVSHQLGLGSFLSNVFFLQGILTTTYGSNTPLWSLSYEFWYYAAFPCLCLALTTSKAYRWLYVALVIAIGYFVGHSISLFFPIWLLGTLVIYLPRLWVAHQPLHKTIYSFSLLFFALCLFGSVATGKGIFEPVIGVSFAILLYVSLRVSGPAESEAEKKSTSLRHTSLRKRYASFSSWLSDFSFSLYVFHMPPLVFLHAYLYHEGVGKWQPDLPHVLMAAGIGCITLSYAWLLSRLTEARTADIRSVFLKRPIRDTGNVLVTP